VYGTVVVGHDGTPAADAALRLAEQLAAADARLLVARVVPAASRGAGEAALVRVRAGTGAQRVEPRAVTAHSVERGLAALAAEVGADLIVVGSDRRPHDYRAHHVLGLRLLRGAPCAVAIAPAAAADPAVRHIGVAYDGSPEAEPALATAYGLAQRLGAALTLYLAVLPEPIEDMRAQLVYREAGALLDAAAERAPAGVNPETVLLTGYASSALAERVAGVVDLLVVGSRRQGPIRQALLGSTSRALAVELDCALLVTARRSAAAPGPPVPVDDRGALRGEVQ
jgi:nucleotide-binding universal stress UspA family protein